MLAVEDLGNTAESLWLPSVFEEHDILVKYDEYYDIHWECERAGIIDFHEISGL